MSTETVKDQDVNAALARAMGWREDPGGEWRFPGPGSYRVVAPPDYFGPRASAELEDWLHTKGCAVNYYVGSGTVSVELDHGRRKYDGVEYVAVTVRPLQSPSAARRAALARAAHAALCQPEAR
jgi:hypothetical protein